MDDGLDWIRAGLKQPGKTQTGLAKAFGRSPSAITALLKNGRRLQAHEIATAAKYLGVAPPPGTYEPGREYEHRPPVTRIVGYVGAGAAAHNYAVAQGDLDEIAAPEGASEHTVAVEIRGNSLGELFDRWLVFYDDVRRPVTEDLIGKLCVVGLADGRVLIKKIGKESSGFYALLSEKEPPIENAVIEWAARVKAMAPR
jgi:hypothetical protein